MYNYLDLYSCISKQWQNEMYKQIITVGAAQMAEKVYSITIFVLGLVSEIQTF